MTEARFRFSRQFVFGLFLTILILSLVFDCIDNKSLTPAISGLGNQFLLVSNILVADASNIIQGNQRVMHARLQDAVFLYDQDLKNKLHSNEIEFMETGHYK